MPPWSIQKPTRQRHEHGTIVTVFLAALNGGGG